MRYEEFEVMQTRFNDLDRRLQLILLGWVVSIAAFMVGLRLLTERGAALCDSLTPTLPGPLSIALLRPEPCAPAFVFRRGAERGKLRLKDSS